MEDALTAKEGEQPEDGECYQQSTWKDPRQHSSEDSILLAGSSMLSAVRVSQSVTHPTCFGTSLRSRAVICPEAVWEPVGVLLWLPLLSL
jgi:hypothetical protein